MTFILQICICILNIGKNKEKNREKNINEKHLKNKKMFYYVYAAKHTKLYADKSFVFCVPKGSIIHYSSLKVHIWLKRLKVNDFKQNDHLSGKINQ